MGEGLASHSHFHREFQVRAFVADKSLNEVWLVHERAMEENLGSLL